MRNESPAPLAGGNRAGIDAQNGSGIVILSRVRLQHPARLRRQHLARQLYRLGDRVTFEFIDELARHLRIDNEIDERLARYAQLDPDLLHAVGADSFPPVPLHAVGDDEG